MAEIFETTGGVIISQSYSFTGAPGKILAVEINNTIDQKIYVRSLTCYLGTAQKGTQVYTSGTLTPVTASGGPIEVNLKYDNQLLLDNSVEITKEVGSDGSRDPNSGNSTIFYKVTGNDDYKITFDIPSDKRIEIQSGGSVQVEVVGNQASPTFCVARDLSQQNPTIGYSYSREDKLPGRPSRPLINANITNTQGERCVLYGNTVNYIFEDKNYSLGPGAKVLFSIYPDDNTGSYSGDGSEDWSGGSSPTDESGSPSGWYDYADGCKIGGTYGGKRAAYIKLITYDPNYKDPYSIDWFIEGVDDRVNPTIAFGMLRTPTNCTISPIPITVDRRWDLKCDLSGGRGGSDWYPPERTDLSEDDSQKPIQRFFVQVSVDGSAFLPDKPVEATESYPAEFSESDSNEVLYKFSGVYAARSPYRSSKINKEINGKKDLIIGQGRLNGIYYNNIYRYPRNMKGNGFTCKFSYNPDNPADRESKQVSYDEDFSVSVEWSSFPVNKNLGRFNYYQVVIDTRATEEGPPFNYLVISEGVNNPEESHGPVKVSFKGLFDNEKDIDDAPLQLQIGHQAKVTLKCCYRKSGETVIRYGDEFSTDWFYVVGPKPEVSVLFPNNTNFLSLTRRMRFIFNVKSPWENWAVNNVQVQVTHDSGLSRYSYANKDQRKLFYTGKLTGDSGLGDDSTLDFVLPIDQLISEQNSKLTFKVRALIEYGLDDGAKVWSDYSQEYVMKSYVNLPYAIKGDRIIYKNASQSGVSKANISQLVEKSSNYIKQYSLINKDIANDLWSRDIAKWDSLEKSDMKNVLNKLNSLLTDLTLNYGTNPRKYPDHPRPFNLEYFNFNSEFPFAESETPYGYSSSNPDAYLIGGNLTSDYPVFSVNNTTGMYVKQGNYFNAIVYMLKYLL